MEQNIIVEGFNKSEKDYGLRYKYFIGDGLVRTIIARTRDINLLHIDLKNCPKHVFGDHNSCRTEVCTKKTLPIANEVPLLESSKIFCEILKVSDSVIRKSDRLCKNVTTNYAERYMSVIAKFTGGKRTNLIQRGVYRFRCFGAGLAYNWGPSFHKLISPNNCFLERLCRRRQQKKHSIRKQKQMDYGSNCAEPDLSLDNLEIAKQKIISSLVVNTVDLEKCTIGQRNNII
ncbi:hypothetical protein RN001_002408 [Aquatica leii]|uniref:Uncharacterized protein n=1 Tax=Aquatica leii TaxID=1421715 RepID=A0AAN7PGY6_9COLE|nr:hypothetical protein RN001_002408 [Aquatica leii]